MTSPYPDPDRERFPLPWEDDDTPGLSIHPLTQADVDAILAHLGDLPDDDPGFHFGPALTSQARRPRVAAPTTRPAAAGRGTRSRGGRPGGSVQAEYQRRRAREHTTWAHTLPWRLAATLGIGVTGGVVGSLLAPRLGLVLGGLAAVAAGWGLRFRPEP
jgi:hypothetical protein